MTERYAYDYEEGFFVDMSIVDENGLGEEMLSSDVVERLNTLQAERDALANAIDRATQRLSAGKAKRLDFKCSHCGKNTPLLIDGLLNAIQEER